MPTPPKGARLGGSPAHERLLLANLATALFEHRRITTTEAKARRLRPFAERLVTKAKRGDLHARRQVMAVIRDKTVVHELFTDIAPSYAGRAGGYTRITKIGPRKGDNAPMAVIEMVEPLAEQAVAEASAATKRAAKEQAERAAAAAATGRSQESAKEEESTAEPGEGQWKSAAEGSESATQWKSAAEGDADQGMTDEASSGDTGTAVAAAGDAPASESEAEPTEGSESSK